MAVDDKGEDIVICVDNSGWMLDMCDDESVKSSFGTYQIQRDAIEHYCRAKFAEHPDNAVALFAMGAYRPKFLLAITRSLPKIIDALKKTRACLDDELDLEFSLAWCTVGIAPVHDDKKKRIIFFVGGPTNMSSECAEEFGKRYRDFGIAVDIVNFYPSETPGDDEKTRGFIYGRKELYEFFNICNCSNGNSHFVDVGPGSNIFQLISDSMLKKIPCLSEKGNDNAAEAELELPSKKCRR